MKTLLHQIAETNHFHLSTYSELSGGDINAVYLLQSESGKFVVKVNSAEEFPGMFDAEARGLQLLTESGSFRIPQVKNHGSIGPHSYLLLEYIPSTSPNLDFAQQFAKNLATLHSRDNSYFGLDHDNYIGSLKQHNDNRGNAADFYISQRLEPQFRLAADKGFRFKSLDDFYSTIIKVIPDDPPSLIHGDLWSGNFLVSESGSPTLIDPAISFAPREMDLAMMQLFGGFSEETFHLYNENFPLTSGWNERIPLWQLYYLLVHLNLFGSGYLSGVQRAMRPFL